MATAISELVVWLIEKITGISIDQLRNRHALNISRVSVDYLYSHYKDGNHVRQGGEKKIYKSFLGATIHNPNTIPKTMRELSLLCALDGIEHRFNLYDNIEEAWKQNYVIPANSVLRFSWRAMPEGYGIWDHEPGILPFSDNSVIQFHLTYMDDYGKCRSISISQIACRRMNPDLILSLEETNTAV